MKILHLPSNVSGNAYGLSQGERAIGLESDILSIGPNPYKFPTQIYIPNPKFSILKLIKTFYKIRKYYDIFHFNFGSSLFNISNYKLLELPLYPSDCLKVVTYQGCDARQKYPTIMRNKILNQYSACQNNNCYNGICNSGKKDIIRQKNIDKMLKYCMHAFAVNPDLLHFLPREKASFLPYTVPNFDLIPEKSQNFFENDKIKILHAPTQKVTKGTDYIISAVNKLIEKYPNLIEFILIENIPNEQALKLYQQADLVIDQVLIGWYGAFAVEVMKMGIPVAAYINEYDLEFIPKDMANDLPVININPITIEKEIEKIILNREILKDIGLKSMSYAKKWHNPEFVASLTEKVYKNEPNFGKINSLELN